MIHRQFYYLMVYKIQIGSLYEDVQCADIGNSLLGIGTVIRIPKQIVLILMHEEIPFYTLYTGLSSWRSILLSAAEAYRSRALM